MGQAESLPHVASPQAILEALPAHVAVLDANGVIVAVNEAWRRFAADNGLLPEACAAGCDYLAACREAASGGDADASRVAEAIADVLAGRRAEYAHEYACHAPDTRRWFRMTVSPLRDGERGAVVMHVDITQRRLAEQAIKDQAEMLRAAQRLAGLGYWYVDISTMRVTLSQEAIEILGVERGDEPTTYQGLLLRLDAADRAHVDSRLRELIASGGTQDLQHRIRRADGQVRWLRALVGRMAGEEGGGPRITGTWMDITERRAAGDALRASEARYRQRTLEFAHVLDSSLDLICTFDAHDCFVLVSAACRRILGYGPEELVGRPVRDLIHPDDLVRTEEVGLQVRGGTPVRGFENRLRAKDGSFVAVSWTAWWSPAEQRMFCVARDMTDALRVVAANRQLAERLSATLETMTDGFITLDRALKVTYVNRATEQAVRVPRDQLLGKTLADVFQRDGTQPFLARYREALETGRPAEFEEFFAPLGMWVEVRAYPVSEGLAIYFRDVTERHRTQKALRESEERFKLVAEATTDAIWDWNIAIGTAWLSEAWTRIFGVPQDEREGAAQDSWLELIHPEDRDRVHASITAVLEGGGFLWTDRYRLRRRDGTYAHVVDRGAVMRDGQGRAVRMLGGVVDLTAQLDAQDRLHEQAQLLDAARDAIQVRDPQNRILYCNRSAERLYGWSAAEAIGRDAAELMGHDTAAFAEACRILMEEGAWRGELEKRTRDGRRLVIEGHWTLLRDAEGQPQRILSIDTDVTERRELERQLIRSQRMESIGTLAGGIAHDLNNVLTPILMSANLLRRPGMDAEDEQLLEAISKSAQRGADMITQLLSFARGVEGKHVAFDPVGVAQDVRRIVSETFPRDIDVVLEAQPDVASVRGDATQLHQVILNLCLNARDAMPQGGLLTVGVRNGGAESDDGARPGARVVIEVSDTGTGIPEHMLDKIFDPFFTTKDLGKGTGLGLPTSLAIVRRHGGAIRVSSRPGEGSRFTILLPACDEPAMPQQGAGEERPRGEGETILVVDDEQPIREVTEQTLRAYGYEVIAAADGAEALALYAKLRRTVDLVLVDMMMPVMDGAATIQALRRLNPSLRIVATSGIADDHNVGVAADAGVTAFMPKPYTTEALLTTLRRALRRPALNAATVR